MSIKMPVILLIRVAQQTVVTGHLTPFIPAGSGLAAHGIEVKKFKRSLSHASEFLRVGDQSFPQAPMPPSAASQNKRF